MCVYGCVCGGLHIYRFEECYVSGGTACVQVWGAEFVCGSAAWEQVLEAMCKGGKRAVITG